MSVLWVGAAATVASGAMQYSSAKSAAKSQKAAADDATALQREQFEATRADQLPYQQRGNAAGNRLQQLMGLSTGSVSAPQTLTPGADGVYAPNGPMTADAIREELRGQYIRQGAVAAPPVATGSGWDPASMGGISPEGGGGSGESRFSVAAPGAPVAYDDAALEAAVQARLATQKAQEGEALAAEQADPAFGSLMKTFTGADLVNEPGYQFGLEQGTRSMNGTAAARGNLLSGAAIKEAARYGTDYAGTKFGEAFNRDASTKNRLYNQLAGIAGTGQTANGQVATAGMNYANNAGNIALGVGNAQGASQIAGSNALSTAVNGAVAGYQRFAQPQVPVPPVYDGGYGMGTGSAYGGNRAGL